MKTSVTIISCLLAALFLALCCVCLIVLSAAGAYFSTAPQISDPGFPFTLPTPVPQALLRPAEIISDDTLRKLLETIVPENDPYDLAARFEGLVDIPRTLPAPQFPLQIGARQTFWALDVDTNDQFQIEASLRYITAHLYFWIESGVEYDEQALSLLAEEFESYIYPTVRGFFGSEWSPGIDSDPHIYILFAQDLGGSIAGYFSSIDELHPLASEYSNGHEIFFLNSDNVTLSEDFTYSVLAHEFQHMIHWNLDRNETSWINEGFSEVAAFLSGYDLGGFDGGFTAAPDLQLTYWPKGGSQGANYGGAFLYLVYFLDRFGETLARRLAAHPANDLASVDRVLAEAEALDSLRGRILDGDDVFQDWSAALYLNNTGLADGRYGFRLYPQLPEAGETETVRACPSGPQARDVHQYGIDYIRITCSGTFTLHFEGSTAVPLLPAEPHSGAYAFWSNRVDESDTTLTRLFDFRDHSGPLTLQYWLWYDIESDYDYAYLTVSTDGERWEILTTPAGTPEDPTGANYGWAYNGNSRGWIEERVDLSDYAGQEILLRFEYITDAAVNENGLLIDDISIPEIGYRADFEQDDGGWQADGFVRLHNLLPQTYRLTLIRIGSSGILVEPLLLPSDNILDLSITLGGDFEELILIVSGTTRYTVQKTGYLVEIK